MFRHQSAARRPSVAGACCRERCSKISHRSTATAHTTVMSTRQTMSSSARKERTQRSSSSMAARATRPCAPPSTPLSPRRTLSTSHTRGKTSGLCPETISTTLRQICWSQIITLCVCVCVQGGHSLVDWPAPWCQVKAVCCVHSVSAAGRRLHKPNIGVTQQPLSPCSRSHCPVLLCWFVQVQQQRSLGAPYTTTTPAGHLPKA